MNRLNVVFVFADQWRAQDTGYAGNTQVDTPHLDRLARESVNFTHAVSGWPVCSPWRGSLLTGQYPLTHGIFVNDVPLADSGTRLGEAFSQAGYDTAWIGKWHIDGHGRSEYIPPERRHGFDYWKTLECTHDYHRSAYYAGNVREKRYWEGYDAFAQTRDAQRYLRARDGDSPFLLVLSWGPPHNPYETAPEAYRRRYRPEDILLRPNVPEDFAREAREWLAGYYAHCTALDDCVATLLETLAETGLDDNTIFVFTSDHGDMLGSQGTVRKQRPWDESIRVPFLLRCPGVAARETDALINAPDLMPTLLGLCDLPLPASAEGLDFSDHIRHSTPDPSGGAALLACYHPFGEWTRSEGGREFRGLRTRRHTYTRTLEGPWQLYDNEADPWQLQNRINDPACRDLRLQLDARLGEMLARQGDEFLHGDKYIRRWGYTVDETGTVPYSL
ncbi:MAG: sulfatase-like hydrolase/transferase [Anaerolineaceae bacterium]|nr:sulfatase-like hydrolase/transferase [Anaerolineaceae bacterium]MDE0329754.1 sulfatase-like hydrolase/transferase [Anaerolineaceae bacterium]